VRRRGFDFNTNFDFSAQGAAMSNLASTYDKLGMHEAAAALRAEALELLRSILPDDHADIGESSCAVAQHDA
jgi:hypothetical protein